MNTLRIEEEMTIWRAAELRQQLQAALAGGAPLALDLSAVTEVDTSGVQLLLAAAATARQRATELRLVAPSAALRDTLGLLGLHALLEEPA